MHVATFGARYAILSACSRFPTGRRRRFGFPAWKHRPYLFAGAAMRRSRTWFFRCTYAASAHMPFSVHCGTWVTTDTSLQASGAATFSGTTTINTVDCNGGAIDATAIGAATASTGAFTSLDAISGVAGGRICEGESTGERIWKDTKVHRTAAGDGSFDGQLYGSLYRAFR